jgi:hypothetical protein
LRDIASIALDHGAGRFLIAAHDRLQVFRVEARRQLGGTDQIAEEDGELAPLAFGRGWRLGCRG